MLRVKLRPFIHTDSPLQKQFIVMGALNTALDRSAINRHSRLRLNGYAYLLKPHRSITPPRVTVPKTPQYTHSERSSTRTGDGAQQTRVPLPLSQARDNRHTYASALALHNSPPLPHHQSTAAFTTPASRYRHTPTARCARTNTKT